MKQRMYTLANDNGDGGFSIRVFKSQQERTDFIKKWCNITLDDENAEDETSLYGDIGELDELELEIVDGIVQNFEKRAG